MIISRRAPRGFTLVELLVVIGIIALLLSVLLPVLSGVGRRGREVKCASNLRTAVQLFLTYAAENKGSLPYGWYFNKSHPVSWDDLAGDGRLTTCFALISRMSNKAYKGDDVFIQSGQSTNPENPAANYAPFLRCPEAEQAGGHICSYAVQFCAFITPYYERVFVASGPIQDKPAKVTDLMPFTVLIHDTAIHLPGMTQDVGYVGDADVDAQAFWAAAAIPQHRYYEVNDRYAAMTNPALRRWQQNNPVAFGNPWYNIDPPPTGPEGFNSYYYQGNLRYRHGKNNTCNVGYADGRVEGIQAQFNPDGSMKKPGLVRKNFMIKWPKGMGLRPNPSVP
jgi:prepilin-type N-terminal cleavage/methylation domain-containing protein/prepilin-type processing-associated H-X9-DG protein